MNSPAVSAMSMPATSIDEFHNRSSLHHFYSKNSDYTRSLRKIFALQHLERLKMTRPTSLACEMADGVYYKENYLSDILLENQIVDEAFRCLGEKGEFMYPLPQSYNVPLSGDITLAAIRALLTEELTDAIRVYFGSLTPAIMEAHAFTVRRRKSYEKTNISGYWHRDSVGSRLKLFWCVHEAIIAPETLIIAGNLLDPAPREWEMIRTALDSASDESNTRLERQLVCFHPKRIHQVKNSLLIFDTNCVHKGDYEPIDIVNENQAPSLLDEYRVVFQISIIAREALLIHECTHPQWYYQDCIQVSDSQATPFPLLDPPFIKTNLSDSRRTQIYD